MTGVDAAEVDVQLPRAEQREQQHGGQHDSASCPHPQRLERLLAQRDDGRIDATPRARELDRDLGDGPARARRHHDHPVGEHDGLLDVVGDEHDRPRLELEDVGEPALHLRCG